MTTPERGQRTPGRRGNVLQLLRSANEPLGIADIADRLGIHANTVRFHLETLVENGQVERGTADRGAPGRPPQLFRAVRGMDPMGPRHYRLLAEVLVARLAGDPDSRHQAAEAGRAWGRLQASEVADQGDGEPVGRLMSMLDELGFAPERTADGDLQPIRLRHCPFLELAVSKPEVVCPVHLGLMEGAMDSWDAPITVDRLEAFVEPDLCLAHLAAVGTS